MSSAVRGSSSPTTDLLDDYLALCKEACDGEIDRLYGDGDQTGGLRD